MVIAAKICISRLQTLRHSYQTIFSVTKDRYLLIFATHTKFTKLESFHCFEIEKETSLKFILFSRCASHIASYIIFNATTRARAGLIYRRSRPREAPTFSTHICDMICRLVRVVGKTCRRLDTADIALSKLSQFCSRTRGRDDKSPRRHRQSCTNENTKELLLDKLHVSHNERAARASRFRYIRESRVPRDSHQRSTFVEFYIS